MSRTTFVVAGPVGFFKAIVGGSGVPAIIRDCRTEPRVVVTDHLEALEDLVSDDSWGLRVGG